MPTNKGKRNADLEAARGGRPKRGVSAVASTATAPRRSGRGGAATPLAPAAIAVGTSSPLPFQQVVTRLWSKGSVVKKINAVQDESAKKLPPQHIMGSGLRKSPPELNAVTVSTGGGAASAVTGPAGAAAAAVNTSSWRSGRNTIALSDAAGCRQHHI